MNSEQLARATFVLDRATSDRLTVIAGRMGVSRSALVRDVLQEPVELMHRWVTSMPANATPEDADALLGRMETDLGSFIDSKAAQLDLLRVEEGGNG